MKKIILCIAILFICCENECQRPDRCNLLPDPGLCKAYFPKYYFDKVEGKCKEFIWGGCDGVVPFNTLEECKQCECINEK